MPSYRNYLIYASTKGFQPVSLDTFNALLKAKFNPVTNTFVRS